MHGSDLLALVIQRAGKTLSAATRAKLDAASTRITDAATSLQDAAQELADLLAETDRQAATLTTALGDDATEARIAALKVDAQAGQTWRTQLIDQTVQARVAVAGDTFDASAYRARLARRDLEDIQDDHAIWTQQRSASYRPGRQLGAGPLPGEPTDYVGAVRVAAE